MQKKGYKYFVSYKNNEKPTLLYLLLPKMSGYVENFNDVNFKCCLKFLILTILKRKIFDRSQAFRKIGNKKLKTKRKSCNNKITTNFHGKVL